MTKIGLLSAMIGFFTLGVSAQADTPSWADEVDWTAADAQTKYLCPTFNEHYGTTADCTVDRASFDKNRPLDYFKKYEISRMYYPASTCTSDFMMKTVADRVGGGGAAETCSADGAGTQTAALDRCRATLAESIKHVVCAFSSEPTAIKYDKGTKTLVLSAGPDIDCQCDMNHSRKADHPAPDFRKISRDFTEKQFPVIHAANVAH